MSHTPEPWSKGFTRTTKTICGNFVETSIHVGSAETCGNAIAIVHLGGEGAIYDTQEAVEANAARIVACINACAGIENPAELREEVEALRERLRVENDETGHEVVALREQRDELLKAVQNMIALYKFNKPKHWGEGTETMISVRATLAKIKGAA